MSTFIPSDLVTAWTFDVEGIVLCVLAAVPYVLLVRRAARAGQGPSSGRVLLYALLGVGTLAYATCGAPAVFRAQVFWLGAMRVGILATVTPIGLALGDPVGMLQRLHPSGDHLLLRVVRGRVARVLTFPAVSTLLATGTLLLVFVTPLFVSSVTSTGVGIALDLVLLVTGLVFVVPLLAEDLLPSWATAPVRAFLAFADGLLDAVPGIVVMTAPTLLSPTYPGFSSGVSGLDPLLDQRIGGGTLLAVAESVGLPVIAAVFVDWVRSDERDARAADLLEDQALAAAAQAEAPEPAAAPDAPAAAPPPATPAGSGLWWEQDPRLAGRFGRPPAGSRPVRPAPGRDRGRRTRLTRPTDTSD
ncbi:cytochrome c oxidase assembly protein [Terrabacter sp. NPDC080008]|uniref:cytochrome c oxidase assembly protein n=1 Tax=Terrabacter sp. NPDC080008 TaxID=3155176 RepID=UPI00344D70EF